MSVVEQSLRSGGVQVIAIANPPVNALSQAVRQGLVEAVTAAQKNPDVRAIVVTGNGALFSGGADISEFGKPLPSPDLNDVIAALENSAKPTVAAIHGRALGGGLEVALGCHYRVIAATGEVGLPEVKLGLLPGAGGTQRLPRLVGVEAAVGIITTGRFVKAKEALSLGIVDEIADGDVVAHAVTAAAKLADGGKVRRTRDIAPAKADAETLAKLRADVTKAARGLEAPVLGLEAVEASLTKPFDDGLKNERALFDKAMHSPQGRAQIHAFFAERAASKVVGLPKDTKERPVKTVGVIGAGTMGGGISMALANAGIPVTLVEANQKGLDAGLEKIKANYASTVAKGRLSQADMDKRMALISPTLDLNALATVDMVVEAVFEEMSIKREIFQKLDKIAKPGAVLATNTSALDINVIANETKRPEDVIGMHFFSPANIMRLVEVVRGAKTAPDIIVTALKVSRTIGKLPVLVNVCDGFVGNRMYYCYLREAEFLIEEGASPEQVDKAFAKFGFAMGPVGVIDLAGIDIMWRRINGQKAEGLLAKGVRHPQMCFELAERGRYGQKTNAGFFKYEAGNRKPINDPMVEDLAKQIAARDGITRRTISDDEILERCLYTMVNEGARILEEGVAQRPGDIDIIYIHGYGFPVGKGGPMQWADEIGLKTVLDGIKKYQPVDKTWWTPAPLLVRLAEAGSTFREEFEKRGT
jgi:3-hydroxyacyl-CoA dehydrogenase